MPRKPRKPCKIYGCPNLTDETYCAEHKAQAELINKERARLENRNYDRFRRDKEHSKKYGSAWQKIRKRYAAAHPYCERCFEKGLVVYMDEVHHEIPLADGGTNDEENLVSLCRSCHFAVEPSRHRKRARGASLE